MCKPWASVRGSAGAKLTLAVRGGDLEIGEEQQVPEMAEPGYTLAGWSSTSCCSSSNPALGPGGVADSMPARG
jgi:hypothetical protein